MTRTICLLASEHSVTLLDGRVCLSCAARRGSVDWAARRRQNTTHAEQGPEQQGTLPIPWLHPSAGAISGQEDVCLVQTISHRQEQHRLRLHPRAASVPVETVACLGHAGLQPNTNSFRSFHMHLRNARFTRQHLSRRRMAVLQQSDAPQLSDCAKERFCSLCRAKLWTDRGAKCSRCPHLFPAENRASLNSSKTIRSIQALIKRLILSLGLYSNATAGRSLATPQNTSSSTACTMCLSKHRTNAEVPSPEVPSGNFPEGPWECHPRLGQQAMSYQALSLLPPQLGHPEAGPALH